MSRQDWSRQVKSGWDSYFRFRVRSAPLRLFTWLSRAALRPNFLLIQGRWFPNSIDGSLINKEDSLVHSHHTVVAKKNHIYILQISPQRKIRSLWNWKLKLMTEKGSTNKILVKICAHICASTKQKCVCAHQNVHTRTFMPCAHIILHKTLQKLYC